MSQVKTDINIEELLSKLAKQAEEIKQLNAKKKFGLVWEDKPDAQVLRVRNEAPMLSEYTSKAVVTDQNATNHILINGDNFHALTALRATHTGKVDVIYIDPPYNTGSKDFIYNDDYLDKEDGYRHSKWLSFMEKRLNLAKELLTDLGVIFISIDDNEHSRLKLLMDEIFGPDNFVANAIVENNPKGRKNSSFLSGTHEYCLIYVKSRASYSKQSLKFNQISMNNDKDNRTVEQDILGPYKKGKRQLIGKNSNLRAVSNPKRAFSVYYVEDTNSVHCIEEYDTDKDTFFISEIGQVLLTQGAKRYLPVDSKTGKPNIVTYTQQKIMELHEENNLLFLADCIYQKERDFTQRLKSIISYSNSGKNVLSEMAGKSLSDILQSGSFSFPKSVELVSLLISLHPNSNAIVLDFFAGSGTTAQAVAELNKEDGGRRQCILVTDGGKTEVTGESSKNSKEGAVNIAEEITYERVRRVLTGKDWADGKEHEPLGGNLRYFKVEMEPVASGLTELDQRFSLEKYAVEHAKIAVNLFIEVLSKDEFDEETCMTVDYKVYADEPNARYLVGVNSHDYALSDLEEWFNGLPTEATVVMVGNGLEEIAWVKKNADRITVDDVLGRVIRSRKYVASKLPLA